MLATFNFLTPFNIVANVVWLAVIGCVMLLICDCKRGSTVAIHIGYALLTLLSIMMIEAHGFNLITMFVTIGALEAILKNKNLDTWSNTQTQAFYQAIKTWSWVVLGLSSVWLFVTIAVMTNM